MTSGRDENGSFPLVGRYPALASVPRVRLGNFPTPVEQVDLPQGAATAELWIKRDDLTASTLGGNKIRSLEFLLARVSPGDRVLTVGSLGSTHALATAHVARALGASTTVISWRQEMNAIAAAVSSRIDRLADERVRALTPVDGYLRAFARRVSGDVRWVPAGGTSPLGMLGHVNAALELERQIRRGAMPPPARVIVPLGTGGTVAGLALGCAIAALDVEVVAVRVVPRLVANRARLAALMRGCSRLIARSTGERPPRGGLRRVRIVHGAYGGAYGRPTSAGMIAAERLRQAHGVVADPTYSAKALAVALAEGAGGVQLFWLTFDARCIPSDGSAQ